MYSHLNLFSQYLFTEATGGAMLEVFLEGHEFYEVKAHVVDSVKVCQVAVTLFIIIWKVRCPNEVY